MWRGNTWKIALEISSRWTDDENDPLVKQTNRPEKSQIRRNLRDTQYIHEKDPTLTGASLYLGLPNRGSQGLGQLGTLNCRYESQMKGSFARNFHIQGSRASLPALERTIRHPRVSARLFEKTFRSWMQADLQGEIPIGETCQSSRWKIRSAESTELLFGQRNPLDGLNRASLWDAVKRFSFNLFSRPRDSFVLN